VNFALKVVNGSGEFSTELCSKLTNLLIYFDEDREEVARLINCT
jgi:hypothetical protein